MLCSIFHTPWPRLCYLLCYHIISLWWADSRDDLPILSIAASLVLEQSYNNFSVNKVIQKAMSKILLSGVPDFFSLIATRFWVVVICPIIKCLTVSEFSFILFDLCLFITIFNFILIYVTNVTFWIFTYHKIWILSIIFCFIWNYWIIYFLTCLEVFWSVVS